MTEHRNNDVHPASRETNLLDLLLLLAANKRTLILIPLVVAILTAAASLFMKNVYTATARILPPQQGASASLALLTQLAGQSGAASSALGSVGSKNVDLYAGLLKGQTIADRLIDRFKLKDRYGKRTVVDTRVYLASRTELTAGRDGIISISVEDTDPQFAADVANAYVEELQRLTEGMAITEAAQRRLFFERELQKARVQLADAEVEMRKTQETTGLIQLDDQGKAIIEAIARLRGEIAAKEVQIVSMKSFATESNPELVRLRQQLGGLRAELAKLEKNSNKDAADVLIPPGRVPEAGLQYVRKLRELKYSETIFELLAKQYEVARLDEAKDMAVIQLVDRAVPPDRKTKPQRSLIVLAMFSIAGIGTLVWILVREAVVRARKDPETNRKLQALRALVTRV